MRQTAGRNKGKLGRQGSKAVKAAVRERRTIKGVRVPSVHIYLFVLSFLFQSSCSCFCFPFLFHFSFQLQRIEEMMMDHENAQHACRNLSSNVLKPVNRGRQEDIELMSSTDGHAQYTHPPIHRC